MNSLNKVILIGNVGRDPEVRSFGEGNKVANVSLATTETYKDKSGNFVDDTTWHNLVMYGATAEYVERNVSKGMSICVEGKIKYRQYVSKDNNKVNVYEVNVSNLILLSKKQSESNASASAGWTRSEPAPSPRETNDDLPF